MVEAAGSCNKSVALPDQSMETHARSIKLDSNSFLEFPSNFESICLLIQLTPPFFFYNNQADNALSLTMELQARITLQSHLFTLRKEKKSCCVPYFYCECGDFLLVTYKTYFLLIPKQFLLTFSQLNAKGLFSVRQLHISDEFISSVSIGVMHKLQLVFTAITYCKSRKPCLKL